VNGSVDSVRVYPELWPLLIGQLRLAKLVIDAPHLDLSLPVASTDKVSPPTKVTFSKLQNNLIVGLEPLIHVAPRLSLVVENGTLTVHQGKQTLTSVKGLSLRLSQKAADSGSLQARLQASASALTMYHNESEIVIEGLKTIGLLQTSEKELLVSIDDLTLAKPALKIGGDLISRSTSPLFEIDLSGASIDVDATREIALKLAGDTTPVNEIFDYLRGGIVPQISFYTEGETLAELGDLDNIHIEGRLHEGAVSIPDIDLDLTEVNGNVVISEGVLQGTEVSTRLEGSAGRAGSLKVGLTGANDLFQMELMLNADLAQAQIILRRIVDNPDFNQLLDQITDLKGASTGKLLLGDSLSDITARVEVSDLNLSGNFESVPFPIMITKGQIAFTENKVGLKDLSGTLGHSDFSGLEGDINWEKSLRLDVHSGEFGLVLDELFPWLTSSDGAKDFLQEINQATGRMELSALSFKGAVDESEAWQIAATGALENLSIETPRFPVQIKLASGDFRLNAEELSFQNLTTAGLDADLILHGVLKGFPQSIEHLELFLDGKMGRESVAWLRDSLEVPETYSIRTPLTISEAKVDWQPDAKHSFLGNISIEEGPNLTLDVDYRPDQLQINQLAVQDQYSNTDISIEYGKDEASLSFNGTLRHESLKGLFVDQEFNHGQLGGDFSIKMSLSEHILSMAKGRLTGQGLVFPMPSGDSVEIDKVDLLADGTQVLVEATAVSWNDLTWKPFKATVDFNPEKIDVRITEAQVCGIDSQGLLTIAGDILSLDITLDGKELELTTSYSCLTDGSVKMTGSLDFSSKISVQGTARELVSKMHGPLEMSFTNGSIEQSKLLARTLEVLNVTEIVKGKLPNLANTGFAYSTIDIQGDFKGEKLIIEKIHMDGETLDVVGYGEIDFAEETVNIELLTAPFKTANTVVKNIPGVNYLLAGTLVTIPVSVKGSPDDPRVQVMSASSVGSSLLGLGGRIIKSPLKLIETMAPDSAVGKE